MSKLSANGPKMSRNSNCTCSCTAKLQANRIRRSTLSSSRTRRMSLELHQRNLATDSSTMRLPKGSNGLSISSLHMQANVIEDKSPLCNRICHREACDWRDRMGTNAKCQSRAGRKATCARSCWSLLFPVVTIAAVCLAVSGSSSITEFVPVFRNSYLFAEAQNTSPSVAPSLNESLPAQTSISSPVFVDEPAPNILCNSRCQCVKLIDTSQIGDNMSNQTTDHGLGDATSSSVAAFSEDYALDEPEVGQGAGPQESDGSDTDLEWPPTSSLTNKNGQRGHPGINYATHTQDSFDLSKLANHFHGPMATPFGLDTQPQPSAASSLQQQQLDQHLQLQRRLHQQHQHHLARKQQHQPQPTTASSIATNPDSSSTSTSSSNQQQQAGQISYRLVALKSLDLSYKLAPNATGSTSAAEANALAPANSTYPSNLVEFVASQTLKMQHQRLESLKISSNQLQSEFWTELYAIIMYNTRGHLYHLDVSRNSLTKLGLAFTGFIEQNLVASNGTWCFQRDSSNTTTTISSTTSNNNNPSSSSSEPNKPQLQLVSTLSQRKSFVPSRQRNLLSSSGGKFYTSVQKKMFELASQQGLASGHGSTQQANSVAKLRSLVQIRALDLSHNKLKWLISDQFKSLKMVQSIRLDHNHIRFIHQNAFAGLESLRYLNLNHNRLQVIFVEQFQTNYNLLALMIRSNGIAYLRGGSFASLNNLKRLDLSRNRLSILSNNALVGLESLELLNLSSNQFVQAPSASMYPLTSLKQLDLSDILISHLAPGTFFHLPVEQIWLNNNEQLVTIDRGAFWDLPYLRHLYLNSNPMLSRVHLQSFVGVPNLRLIDTQNCGLLQPEVRQLLDGILAKSVQSQLAGQPGDGSSPNSIANSTSNSANSKNMTANNNSTSSNSNSIKTAGNSTDSMDNIRSPPHQLSFASKPFNPDSYDGIIPNGNQPVTHESTRFYSYAYYLATLAFLIGALKLVLKYTSSRIYADHSMGRRRRVYGIDEPPNEGGSISSRSQRHHHLSSLSLSLSSLDETIVGGPQSIQLCEQLIPASLGHAIAMSTLESAKAQVHCEDPENLTNAHLGTQIDHDQMQMLPHADDDVQLSSSRGRQDPEVRSLPDQGNVISRANSFISLDLNHDTNQGQPVVGVITQPELSGANQNHAAHEQLAMSCNSNELGVSNHCYVCPDCPQMGCGQPMGLQAGCSGEASAMGAPMTPDELAAYNMFQSQLYAAGCDYGHANCDHFYKSLGPAMQLADLVNQMDQFYS